MKFSISKSTYIRLSFCCLVPLLAFSTPVLEWVKIQLDPVVTVKFPSQPTVQDSNGMQLYFVRTPEAAYMSFYIDNEPRAGQDPVKEIYTFYLGMMDSMIKNAKATLTDSSTFYMGNYKGIDFSYESASANGGMVKRRNRVVMVENRAYMVGYIPLAQPTDSSQVALNKFMESMEFSGK